MTIWDVKPAPLRAFLAVLLAIATVVVIAIVVPLAVLLGAIKGAWEGAIYDGSSAVDNVREFPWRHIFEAMNFAPDKPRANTRKT